MILDKNDSDKNGDICFDEFKKVFQYLNEKYEMLLGNNKDKNIRNVSELYQCQFTALFNRIIHTFKNTHQNCFHKCKFFKRFVSV